MCMKQDGKDGDDCDASPVHINMAKGDHGLSPSFAASPPSTPTF